MNSSTPLISCIMITADRPAFVKRAIQSFLAQTYPNKELVIYDTGEVGVPIEDIPHVGYYHGDKGTVGQLRNWAIGRASGNILAHMDDDDWSSPDRLEEQFGLLDSSNSDLVGYSSIVYHLQPRFSPSAAGDYWYYKGEIDWPAGASFMYHRRVWEKRKFPPVNRCEDNDFVESRRVCTSMGHFPAKLICSHHGRNVSGDRSRFVEGNRIRLTNFHPVKDESKIAQLDKLLKIARV